MKKTLDFFRAGFFWALYPLLYTAMNNSVRTRIFIMYGQDLLVVRSRFGKKLWSLPGGGVKKGEEARGGAVREIYEEVGITLNPENLKHIGKMDYSKHGINLMLHLFETKLDKKPEIKLQKLEISQAEWLPVASLGESNITPETTAILSKWRADN